MSAPGPDDRDTVRLMLEPDAEPSRQPIGDLIHGCGTITHLPIVCRRCGPAIVDLAGVIGIDSPADHASPGYSIGRPSNADLPSVARIACAWPGPGSAGRLRDVQSPHAIAALMIQSMCLTPIKQIGRIARNIGEETTWARTWCHDGFPPVRGTRLATCLAGWQPIFRDPLPSGEKPLPHVSQEVVISRQDVNQQFSETILINRDRRPCRLRAVRRNPDLVSASQQGRRRLDLVDLYLGVSLDT